MVLLLKFNNFLQEFEIFNTMIKMYRRDVIYNNTQFISFNDELSEIEKPQKGIEVKNVIAFI